jgi:hypothetical protein
MDMTTSSLGPPQEISVLRGSGGIIRGRAKQGQELYTFPGQHPNVGFLRLSCYALESNPFDFVSLDVLVRFDDPAFMGGDDVGTGSSGGDILGKNEGKGNRNSNKEAAAVIAALQQVLVNAAQPAKVFPCWQLHLHPCGHGQTRPLFTFSLLTSALASVSSPFLRRPARTPGLSRSPIPWTPAAAWPSTASPSRRRPAAVAALCEPWCA